MPLSNAGGTSPFLPPPPASPVAGSSRIFSFRTKGYIHLQVQISGVSSGLGHVLFPLFWFPPVLEHMHLSPISITLGILPGFSPGISELCSGPRVLALVEAAIPRFRLRPRTPNLRREPGRCSAARTGAAFSIHVQYSPPAFPTLFSCFWVLS